MLYSALETSSASIICAVKMHRWNDVSEICSIKKAGQIITAIIYISTASTTRSATSSIC